MAGRKFNFNAAEESSIKEKKQETSLNIQSTENLQGKAGTLAQKLNIPTPPKAFDFRFIPRNKLKFYENNEYPQEKIENLAEKILNEGLIHNLEVYYMLDTDTYIIDSGERRCRALDMLIEKYKNEENTETEDYKKYVSHIKQFEKGYPCKVILSTGNLDTDNIDLRIRHYVANEEVRDRDPAETAKRIADLNTLYSMRNESGPKQKININKKIGEDLGLSDRQVKKYKSIQKLIPELKKKFEENAISLTEGSNYANLTEEEQKQLLKLIDTGAEKKKINELYQSISSMKKDMEKKKKEIEALETEKKQAKKQIKEAEKEISALQKKLEEESDQKNIKELETLINSANEKLEEQNKIHESNLKEKNVQIEHLKKELEAHEKKSFHLPKGYQETVQLEMQIEIMKKTAENLKKCFETYRKNYIKNETMEKTPEDYKKEIEELFKKVFQL